MERRIPLEKRKYFKKNSDRSGFAYFKRELVLDGGKWVHPDEVDEPTPTKKYIGGEGERNIGEQIPGRNNFPTAKTEIWSP